MQQFNRLFYMGRIQAHGCKPKAIGFITPLFYLVWRGGGNEQRVIDEWRKVNIGIVVGHGGDRINTVSYCDPNLQK